LFSNNGRCSSNILDRLLLSKYWGALQGSDILKGILLNAQTPFSNDAKKILETVDKGSKVLEVIKNAIDKNNIIQITPDLLTRVDTVLFSQIKDASQSGKTVLENHKEQTGGFVFTPQEKDKLSKMETTINDVRAGAFIFDQLSLLPFDPQIKKNLQTVGTVAKTGAKIAESVQSFIQSGVSVTSSALLTGNVVGAVLGLVGAFGIGGGPSETQIILQEMQGIKDQISDLNVTMNTRFDRVDKQLFEIHRELGQNFNEIFERFKKNEKVQQEIIDRLVVLDKKADAILARLDNIEKEIWKQKYLVECARSFV
jgi:hypothetical protein